MINRQSTIANHQSAPRSWHHRMARLIQDVYNVKCQSPQCPHIAEFVCEWDQQRAGKSVSGQKLYCPEHAGSFAERHRIYLALLPDVPFSQLETTSRDGWIYSDDEKIDRR